MTIVSTAVNDGRGAPPELPTPAASPDGLDAHRGLTTKRLLAETREDLLRRLQRLSQDVDEFWRGSLDCGDFNLVTCSVEASHAVHQALAALEVDRYVTGGSTGAQRL
jgi:hypothetical protein